MTDEKTPSVSNKAATNAVAALKAAHPDEWQALLTEAYEDLGATRKVRRTPEQRAADEAQARLERIARDDAKRREAALAQIQALASAFPDLVEVKAPSLDEPEVPGGEPSF